MNTGTIVVGVDGSPDSDAALTVAARLAKRLDARLVLAHVGHPAYMSSATFAAAGALGPVLPPAVSDPGEEDRGQARRLLGAAQDEVAGVAERTRAVLGEVAASAPTFDRGFVAGAVDAWVGVGRLAMSAATDQQSRTKGRVDPRSGSRSAGRTGGG